MKIFKKHIRFKKSKNEHKQEPKIRKKKKINYSLIGTILTLITLAFIILPQIENKPDIKINVWSDKSQVYIVVGNLGFSSAFKMDCYLHLPDTTYYIGNRSRVDRNSDNHYIIKVGRNKINKIIIESNIDKEIGFVKIKYRWMYIPFSRKIYLTINNKKTLAIKDESFFLPIIH